MIVVSAETWNCNCKVHVNGHIHNNGTSVGIDLAHAFRSGWNDAAIGTEHGNGDQVSRLVDVSDVARNQSLGGSNNVKVVARKL